MYNSSWTTKMYKMLGLFLCRPILLEFKNNFGERYALYAFKIGLTLTYLRPNLMNLNRGLNLSCGSNIVSST